MKYALILSLIFGLILFGCNYDMKSDASAKNNSKSKRAFNQNKDKEEIQTLIRQMLEWADTKSTIDLLPVLSKDSICTGFDLDQEKQKYLQIKKDWIFCR